MGTPSYGNWHKRAFCECGHDLGAPSFGNIWFVQQDYPVCPKCGGSKYGYKLKTVRSVSQGWFKASTYEERQSEQC